MKRKTIYLLLFLSLFIGGFLRIKNISTNPPELFSDEIVPVLSSQNIIKTGQDINGKLMPFFYDKLQLYPPIYGYLTIPSIYFFDLNVFSIRLPGVIAGVLTLYIIFLLTRELLGNNKVALFSVFFLSIIPWAIHFSRSNGTQSLFLLFILTPILFFLKFIRKKSLTHLYLSLSFFALSFYSYAASSVLSPIFLVLLTLLYRKNLRIVIKHYVLALFIAFTILLPFFYISINEPELMNGRSIRISTFAQGVNKDTTLTFIKNYFSHFSLDFLFYKGDTNLRQGTAKNGVLYLSMLPLLILGIYLSIKNIKKTEYKLLLAWIFIFPLGGSLTNDGVPHATRTLIGAPVFVIFSAIGLNFIIENINKIKQKKARAVSAVLIITLVLGVFFLEVLYFYKIYFTQYPVYSSPWWEYGQREVFETVRQNTQSDDTLCLTNIDYWHEETLTKYYLGVNNNYKIIYNLDNPNCLESNILVLSPDRTVHNNYRLIKTVYSLEGNPIWNIYKLFIHF